jgi:hypothetical protein
MKTMKTTSLLAASALLISATALPGAVIQVDVLSDDFDNNTISGGTLAGNTLSFDDGWDIDVTGSASALTSISPSNGFFSPDGSITDANQNVAVNSNFSGDLSTARGFSFTFVSDANYFQLVNLEILSAHISGGGNTANFSSDLTVEITNSGGGAVYTGTQNIDYGGVNWVTSDFVLSGSLNAGSEYTVTATMDNFESGGFGFVAFDGLTLTAAVPEPSSTALLGLGGLALALRRRRS